MNDEETETKKKRKLIPIDDNQDDETKSPNSTQLTVEEKRKHIKDLIEHIPTEKLQLFAYNLDWTIVDKVSRILLRSY